MLDGSHRTDALRNARTRHMNYERKQRHHGRDFFNPAVHAGVNLSHSLECLPTEG
jgi:hypothetical protein